MVSTKNKYSGSQPLNDCILQKSPLWEDSTSPGFICILSDKKHTPPPPPPQKNPTQNQQTKRHLRSPKKENLSLDLKHQFMQRLPLAKSARGLPGLYPLSGPALLFRQSQGSIGAQLCCSGLILNSKAEPGKPALPLQGLRMAGEQSWAVSVLGSKQERQSKRRKKKKIRQANRA